MRSGKLYICLFVLMVAFMVKATAAWAQGYGWEQGADIVNMYITSTGFEIEGDGVDPATFAPDGSIPLINFSQDMSVSYKPGTGEVMGALRFSAVKIQTKVDKSSVLITRAVADRTPISTITIKVYRAGEDGGSEVYYQIDYTNAQFVSITTGTPEPATQVTSPKIAMEFITFVFSNVKWTYTDGGISTDVDWGPPQ